MFPNLVVNVLLKLTLDRIGQSQPSPNITITYRNKYQHRPRPNIPIINRREWDKGADNVLPHPVPYVIIHHTGRSNPACITKTKCMKSIQNLQEYNMVPRDKGGAAMYDIAYNFVVAGDGNVYEGTGWFIKGSHTKVYYEKSIGIAFLGDWNKRSPPKRLLKVAKRLIKLGVAKGYISKKYKLKGHKSAGWSIREHEDEDVSCPALALNKNLQSWEHYDGIV